MKQRLLVIIYRVLVLTFGLLLAYTATFQVFPYLDRRIPAWLAVLVTYGLIAYVGLPALVRIWQALHRPTHVPTRTHAADGWALDPINLIVLAKNEKEFVRAMHKAGWLQADPPTLKNRLRFLYSLFFDRPYPTAPFGTHYVFGRRQDLEFQIPIGGSVRDRHHVRFWQLGTTILEQEHHHHGFWRSLLEKFLKRKKGVWVGAAVIDRGITVRLRNLQFDHGIDSDTMLERDYLVATLKDSGVLKTVTDIKAGEPLHTRHQGFNEKIISDGYVRLCDLRRQLLPR